MSDSISTMSTAEFQIDLQGLIKLLAKNLYAEADVFVREMLQNAHDSIERRRELQGEGAPTGMIRVKIDRDASTISFIDNGAGMRESEIKEYLSTIGRSGTDAFRQDLFEKGRHADVTVIGQFGIGLLSAFIVADRVRVETRSWQSGSPAWRWESRGEKTYNLQPGERQEPGSTVTLYINSSCRDMLQTEELRRIIRKYADFLPFGIYLNEEKAPANAINAPWHRLYDNPKDELMDMNIFVERRFPDHPLSTIPIHITTPYKVDGVLYVSDNRIPDANTTGLVDIYQSRMFVTEANRDILPVWAKFVRGVIDSPALTLTASRDAVRIDSTHTAIKELLGQTIIDHLTQLAKDEPIRFQQICDWHHYHLKGMALQSNEFFDAVADLVPFETNQGSMNLPTYFDEAKQRGHLERDLLYFDERGGATQFYMLCEARGLLVINASYIFENEFLERYAQRHPDIRLRQLNLGGSDFIFEPLAIEENLNYRQLESELMRVMPDRRSLTKMVRFKPVSIPALVVLPTSAKSRKQLEQVRDNLMIPQEVRNLVGDVLKSERSQPVTLYVNADNSTIQQLAKMMPTEDTRSACMAIYHNALMLAQQILTPQNAETMFASFNRIIDRTIAQTDEVKKLTEQMTRQRLEIIQHEQELREKLQPNHKQTAHISCFLSIPSKGYEPLVEALQRVLEDKPFGWQVIRCSDSISLTTISDRVKQLIAQSHCYIAEISDSDPKVLLELGLMNYYEDRQTILLGRQDKALATKQSPPSLITYKMWDIEQPDIDVLVEQLREQLQLKPDLQNLRDGKKTYLSKNLLVRVGEFRDDLAQKIAETYTTVEAFCAAEPKTTAAQLETRAGFIQAAQEFLREYFGL
jgi:molecular chaperone HtpG